MSIKLDIIFLAVQLTLILSKSLGYLNWSWWIILAPILLYLLVLLLIFMVLMITVIKLSKMVSIR